MALDTCSHLGSRKQMHLPCFEFISRAIMVTILPDPYSMHASIFTCIYHSIISSRNHSWSTSHLYFATLIPKKRQQTKLVKSENGKFRFDQPVPIGSMYGICTYIGWFVWFSNIPVPWIIRGFYEIPTGYLNAAQVILVDSIWHKKTAKLPNDAPGS